MGRKFLIFLIVVFATGLIFFKFYAPSYVKSKINELNEQGQGVTVQLEDVKFSYPFKFYFDNLKIFNTRFPFINAYIDKLQTYISLEDILSLALDVKSEGRLYDGELDFDIWKNLRGEVIRAKLILKKVLLTKHSIFQGFSFDGGYLDFNGFNFEFDKNYNIRNFGGDFTISDFKVTDEVTLPAKLTGLIFDLRIPKMNFSKIASNYKLREAMLYINNFKVNSDALNISSNNCEYNTKNSNLSNCIISFNFTEDGLKTLSTYVDLLNQFYFTPNGNTVQSAGTYTIKLDGKLVHPSISFVDVNE